MLKLRYLFENYDLAREALTHWAHDEASLDEALGWYRISSNAIYPYFNNGEICFLRLSPVPEKLERNLRGELEFLDYLAANDYPAPRAIPASDGGTLMTLRTQWGDYYASAFTCGPGTQLEDVELTEPILHAYGLALGMLHALSSRYVPTVRKWNEQDALHWVEAALREYHAPEAVVNRLAFVRDALAKLPRTAANYGLVHYDFEPDNVLYREDTQTCGAIDFEDGMYHWYALDIEQAFGELADMLDEARLPAAKEAFLSGYREAFPLSNDDQRTLPLMREFVDLFGYARILRSVSDTFDDEPDWMVELRAKQNTRIQAYEARGLRPLDS